MLAAAAPDWLAMAATKGIAADGHSIVVECAAQAEQGTVTVPGG